MYLRRLATGRISFFILATALLLAFTARADVPPGTLMWFQSSLASGSGTAEARAVTVDANDNTIVVGRFVGTNNLFGTTLIATSLTVPSGFVAKFDASGTVLWVKKVASNNWMELTAVTTDPAGNIYIGGTASGTFINGPVAFTVPTANGQDAIVFKFDSAGNAIWGEFFGGTSTDTVFGMQYVKDGTIVFGGDFITSITFGTTSYSTRGANDIYVGRLGTDGTVINSWRIGGTRSDTLGGLSVDGDGSVYLAGNFVTSTDFGSGSLAGPGTSDIFLAKYSKLGSLLWYQFYTATSLVSVNSMNVARSNYIWLVGSFTGSLSNSITGLSLTTINGRTWFIMKSDSTGNELLVRKFGDGSGANDLPRGAVVGNSGRLSLTGQVKGSPSDWGSYGTTAGNGAFDTTFATTDDSGTVVWAKQVPTTNAGVAIASTGYGVALLANEDLIVVGFTGTGDYGGGATNVVGTAGKEAFVARYRGFGPDASSSPTNYAAWAARHFTVQTIDDPAYGSITSNPAGDRIGNFWKYVSNQDPWITGTNPVTTSSATNRLSFSFPRSKSVLDARAWLVSATNLASGSWISNATLTTIAPLNANFDRVTLTDGIGVTNNVPKKFLRLAGDASGP